MSNLSPSLSNSVKASTGVEVIHSIEPANYIDAISEYRRAMVGSRSRRIDFFHLKVLYEI